MCKQGHEAVLRERECPKCRSQFFICASCDRGHQYCCRECALAARRETKRRSQRRWRSTELGRQDHRARELERRTQIKFQTRCVDRQSSAADSESGKVAETTEDAGLAAARQPRTVTSRQVVYEPTASS